MLKGLAVILGVVAFVAGHGRLLEPPNRSSLWRFPEFQHLNPPENYEDNELFCGGVEVQYEHNGGKCGHCGDAWNATQPRENENGGLYGQGHIVRTYTQGQLVDIHIELTANHMGKFEMRLCPLPNGNEYETDECFSEPLTFANGLTEYEVTNEETMNFFLQAYLPDDLTCSHCVMQWHYLTANSWGMCPNGTEAVGCGPQEVFRGCSDITILPAQ